MQKVNGDYITGDGIALKINTWDGQYYCIAEILNKIYTQSTAMLSYHNKVLFFRLDLHLENSQKFKLNNREVSLLIEKIRKRVKAKYCCKRLGYMWVREHEKHKKLHYHLIIMIDANKIQHPSALIGWITERWVSRGHPRPHIPKKPFYKVHREDKVTFEEMFYRASYLAKARGKGYCNKSVNNFSSSRIKDKLCYNTSS